MALSLVDVVVLINRGTSLLSIAKAPSGREGNLSDILVRLAFAWTRSVVPIRDEAITRLACAGTRSVVPIRDEAIARAACLCSDAISEMGLVMKR